jgi:hypothetical protein
VETHSAYIEDQLLNQIGVFYEGQRFVLWLGNALVRMASKCQGSAKCYYLTVDSELHIETKIRKKQPVKGKESEESVVKEVVEVKKHLPEGVDMKVENSSLVPVGKVMVNDTSLS